MPEDPDLVAQVSTPNGDGMVTGWFLVAECIDADGQQSLRWASSPGMSDWTAIGLAEFAIARMKSDRD